MRVKSLGWDTLRLWCTKCCGNLQDDEEVLKDEPLKEEGYYLYSTHPLLEEEASW
jgi:hypothetical protein